MARFGHNDYKMCTKLPYVQVKWDQFQGIEACCGKIYEDEELIMHH